MYSHENGVMYNQGTAATKVTTLQNSRRPPVAAELNSMNAGIAIANCCKWEWGPPNTANASGIYATATIPNRFRNRSATTTPAAVASPYQRLPRRSAAAGDTPAK